MGENNLNANIWNLSEAVQSLFRIIEQRQLLKIKPLTKAEEDEFLQNYKSKK